MPIQTRDHDKIGQVLEIHYVLVTFKFPHIRQSESLTLVSHGSYTEPVPWHNHVLRGYHLACSTSESP